MLLCYKFVHILCSNNINVHDRGAMSDRIEDIRKGFLILLPVLDERGRAIIFYDPALSEEQQVEEVRRTQHDAIL